LRVNPVAFAGRCAGDINRNELSIAKNKTVLVSILAVVETYDFSFRVYPGYPRETAAVSS
jgi:hypothetical protein